MSFYVFSINNMFCLKINKTIDILNCCCDLYKTIMDTETINPRRRNVGNNNNTKHSNSDSSNSSNSNERDYLTSSLENLPFFRARYDEQITEEQRKQLILNEFNLIQKEIEIKTYETRFKSNWFRIINTVLSLVILLSAAIIFGIQIASDCYNIGILVCSSIIFFTEGLQKMFRLGPQGVLYKSGTIQLRRIMRQVREYMYMFHRYSSEQLLAVISQLRAQYDDIDLGLYKTSMPSNTKYNTGLDIEQGGGDPTIVPVGQNSFNNNSTPVLNTEKSSPHVHIHIDQSPNPNIVPSPYMPEREHSTPVIVTTNNSNRLRPLYKPETPRRDILDRTNSAPPEINTEKLGEKNHIPTISIDSEEKTPPVNIK